MPCGIPDAGVTSLSAELGRAVTVAEVLPVVERTCPRSSRCPPAADPSRPRGQIRGVHVVDARTATGTVAAMTAHDVLIPVHEGFQPLDVVGPYDVLTGAGRVLEGGAGYRVRLASADGGTVRSVDGLRLGVDEALPEDGPIGTLLVPGGEGTREAMQDEHFVGWVRRAAERSERVVSVCTGAFVLAAAGLLDGLSATTHWRWAPTMQRAFPGVDVRSDPLFVRQGRVWTAAGITAGIDLSLALVEADHGVADAQAVARELVVFLRRPGGQSQFAGPVWAAARASSPRSAPRRT